MTDCDEKDRTLHDAIAKLTAHCEKMNADGELASGWHRNLSPRELDEYTRHSGNTVLLIRHLRRVTEAGAILQPVLAGLIADVLDGKLKATKKRFTAFDRKYLLDLRTTAKGMLETGDPKVLALAGLQQVPATKGKLSAVALELAAKHVGLTPRAFKDRLSPSSKRGKRG
jgi:hypothetical protein